VRPTRRDSADPRAARTLEKIVDAVHELAEAGNRSITVADVIRHAGIGKTAFYSHFSGLSELSLHVFNQSFGTPRSSADDEPLTGEAIVARYAANRAFYATVVSVPLTSEIMSAGIKILAERIGSVSDAGTGTDKAPSAAQLIIAAGIIGAINAWLRYEISVTEQELSTWVDRMIAPLTGIDSA